MPHHTVFTLEKILGVRVMGVITTNNRKMFESIKLMRNVGSEKKYEHKAAGFNSRLQPLQGLVLKEKLRYLNQWNKKIRYQKNTLRD